MSKRRQAFTLIEVLVAMALTMFIMVILTQAFVAGLDTFSGLKAIGDMQEDMRTAATLLKADLSADHFEGKRRPSDRNLNSQILLNGNPAPNPDYEPIANGFVRIVQAKPPTVEGYDKYGLPSLFAGNTYNQTPPPPTSQIDGDKHSLFFTIKERGNQRERFFTAPIPNNSLLALNPSSLLRNLGMESNAAMNPTYTSVYASPWAEVAWFMLPQGDTIQPKFVSSPQLGAPLYSLYRAQFVVPADTANLPPAPTLTSGFATAAAQPGIACIDDPVSGNTIYYNPSDLANPLTRTFNPTNPTRSASLVLKNVLNFEVAILQSPFDMGWTHI